MDTPHCLTLLYNLKLSIVTFHRNLTQLSTHINLHKPHEDFCESFHTEISQTLLLRTPQRLQSHRGLNFIAVPLLTQIHSQNPQLKPPQTTCIENCPNQQVGTHRYCLQKYPRQHKDPNPPEFSQRHP